MTLPPKTFASKLLKRVNLSKEERMLALNDMDYTKKDTLYDQMKQSLKKIKGDQAGCGVVNNGNASVPIKLETTFLPENEEALMAVGYIHQSGVNYYSTGRRDVRGRKMNVERGFKRGGYASEQRGSQRAAESNGGSGQRGSHNIVESGSVGRSRGVRYRRDEPY